MRNKRGQFFLIAAIVIIVVTVGIVAVSNYTEEKESVKLYDLGRELGIESQQVLDYGTYKQLNEEEMKMLMETFIQNYVNYIGDSGNLYFVFGNKRKIYVAAYQNLQKETVCVKLYGGGDCIPLDLIGETKEFPAGKEDIGTVSVVIENYQYEFSLKEGENFYFVIWQKSGDEKVVITSEDV